MSIQNSTQYVVIYTRFSSELQSSSSCDDQERQIRKELARKGIDHSRAIVIRDEAESGTKTTRPGFQRLEEMIRRKEIFVLAVDDQSRLTRAGNAFGFVQNLIFSGGRFLALKDGVDTNDPSWAIMVQVQGIHNHATVRELSHRVRRGQAGRLLAGLTSGNYPYGYGSFFVNPEALQAVRRGPKPEKNCQIYEDEAQWVRKIFDWFCDGESISQIARKLSANNAPRGHRVWKGKFWTHQQVSNILRNPFYIGQIDWGKRTSIRDANGKVKQIPVPESDWVRVQRPDLRIISDDQWKKVQSLLQKLLDVFGGRAGQKKRGPRVHHTSIYPSGMINGMVRCECGSRMYFYKGGKYEYCKCPNARKGPTACKMTFHLPVAKARDAIIGAVIAMLHGQPDWRTRVLSSMRTHLEELSSTVPNELEHLRRQDADLAKQIANLVNALANGSIPIQSVAQRLADLEAEQKNVKAQITERDAIAVDKIELPDDNWLDSQLHSLAAILQEDTPQARSLLRKLVPVVHATYVTFPGKTKGLFRIRFSIDGWAALRSVVTDRRLSTLVDRIAGSSSCQPSNPDEIVIDLGKPTASDIYSPTIYELRQKGVKWKEIQAITGIGYGNASNFYRRYAKAIESKSAQADANSIESAPDERNHEGDATVSKRAAG